MPRINGQSLTEYTLIIATVIMAVVGMELYVKRGLMSKQKAAVEYAVGYLRTETGDNTIPMQYGAEEWWSYETEYDKDRKIVAEDWTLETKDIYELVERSGQHEILPVDPREPE